MTRYAMAIRTANCVRCMGCVVACRAENDVPEGSSRNWIGQTELRGRFPHVGVDFVPGQCMQCEEPHCARVCPVGATSKDEDGVVRIDRDVCIGCRYCVLACPYDARFANHELGVADKCDFCTDRVRAGREPACVQTCPSRTRVFGDLDDPDSEISTLVASERTHRKKLEAGTEPKIFYIDS